MFEETCDTCVHDNKSVREQPCSICVKGDSNDHWQPIFTPADAKEIVKLIQHLRQKAEIQNDIPAGGEHALYKYSEI